MKIDKEKLKELAALSDRELWETAREMARQYGFSLTEKLPPHEDLMRLRRIMRGEERISMKEGMRILGEYKTGGKG